MSNQKSELLIFAGLIPDRPGGVGIHVQRLMDYLELHGIPFTLANYENDSATQLIRAILKAKVVHLHISNPVMQFMITIFCKLLGKKTIVTLHGNYGRFSRLKNWMVRNTLRMATVPVVINQTSYDVCHRLNNRMCLIPAFIPPQKTEILQTEIKQLLSDLHNKGLQIVSTNAYDAAYDKEGREIYGIDFLIHFFKGNTKYALVISDPSGNYSKRYQDGDGIFLIGYPHPYYELLKDADIFVRNTSTDGDSVSVKESLSLGKPALCSDVVDRPKGVVTFKYSDRETFGNCLDKADSCEIPEAEDAAAELVDIYRTYIDFNKNKE